MSAAFILRLHGRCRASGVLPYAGGVLAQPAWILELFDVVDGEQAAARSARAEEAQTERMRQSLERGKGG